jgi:N-acetylneuraminate synthase/N,N'-diacetyllegionaminate synthase
MKRMIEFIEIAGRKIGWDYPTFVIAEAGVNHNGDVDLACQLVDAAVQAKADAVKFQTFIAKDLVKADAPKAEYQKRYAARQESQFEMLKALELSFEEFRMIKAHCEANEITFMSTPFDSSSLNFLDELEVPAFKISSGDLTNLPFLREVGQKGKPVVLSTGMSDLSEVRDAVAALRNGGNEQIALLHCVSNYPADPAEANLRAMSAMGQEFGVPIGFSDHTKGLEVAVAAVALGACIIEKHFTLDRSLAGPDHRASLVPDELNDLIRSIRNVEAALGDGEKKPAASERAIAEVARRSLVAARDITAGTTLTTAMIDIKRPGTGLSPRLLGKLTGHRVRFDIRAGELLTLEMIEGNLDRAEGEAAR